MYVPYKSLIVLLIKYRNIFANKIDIFDKINPSFPDSRFIVIIIGRKVS